MDIVEAITQRRSIRVFTEAALDAETVQELVRAAQHAPSACGMRGARFIFIDEREKLARIRANGGASFLDDAPCAVLVMYNNRTDNTEYRDDVQSAAAAIENLILRAHSLGIGACWVCHLPSKRALRKMFRIPSYYDPIALVALGRYDRLPPAKSPLPVETVLCRNVFSLAEPRLPLMPIGLYARRIARRLYYFFPLRRMLEPIAKKYEKRFDDR